MSTHIASQPTSRSALAGAATLCRRFQVRPHTTSAPWAANPLASGDCTSFTTFSSQVVLGFPHSPFCFDQYFEIRNDKRHRLCYLTHSAQGVQRFTSDAVTVGKSTLLSIISLRRYLICECDAHSKPQQYLNSTDNWKIVELAAHQSNVERFACIPIHR